MKTVIIASENPVKITAVLQGFKSMFPETSFRVLPDKVETNVADQPLTSDETLQGACDRAHLAKEKNPQADFWVGIEGGVEDTTQLMESFAWVVILNKNERLGRAKTSTYFLPQKVAELIRQGKELGEADDIVFNNANTKQKMGSVGILTDLKISRTDFYTQAVILALIPFKNPNLY